MNPSSHANPGRFSATPRDDSDVSVAGSNPEHRLFDEVITRT